MGETQRICWRILLSVNDDKRIQSSDSLAPYTFGTRRELVYKKEENKCNDEIKQCSQWLTLMVKKNIIQTGHKFLIIHTEY